MRLSRGVEADSILAELEEARITKALMIVSRVDGMDWRVKVDVVHTLLHPIDPLH